MELEHGSNPIDIVPLINIVFLLLIFFILMPSFVVQPGIKLNLPRTVTGEIIKYGNLEVAISGNNVIYINNKTLANQELKTLLKQTAKSKVSVLIKADRRASLGRIAEVWDMCRDLGITQVNIVTNQE